LTPLGDDTGESKATTDNSNDSKGETKGQASNAIVAQVQDNKDSTYSVTFQLPHAGLYKVEVLIYGEEMKDAPKIIDVISLISVVDVLPFICMVFMLVWSTGSR
jgi:hypothetical protein